MGKGENYVVLSKYCNAYPSNFFVHVQQSKSIDGKLQCNDTTLSLLQCW